MPNDFAHGARPSLRHDRDQIDERLKLRENFISSMGPMVAMDALDGLEDVYFFVKDTSRRFVYYNRAFAGLLRRVGDELLGMRDEDVSPEYLVEKYRADDEAVLQGNARLVNSVELVSNADGSYDWFTTSKVPVLDPGGHIVGVAGTTRNISQRKDENHFLALAPAIERIMKEFDRAISVGELAASVSLSSSQFTRQFKKRVGTTPHSYIRQVRLNAACDLLATTEASISEVAIRTGYSDQSHLTHDFVARKGISPKKYREKYRAHPNGNGLTVPI
ncbi:AraC family transcriptional regulator [Arthrobacter bambusae]|uniref:AraC family transcriptional regulator n=1 Tax=Arthrobacter bambusae TaxID=1338426 RepID=UPI002781E983|nr:AraC family transcriptional regulator [Arthrobacter bambusae]MDQ0028482.1 PAS domain S-box-containing protein [Arthrobacter bambusae]MDQ0096723.1 PAS domain S-box-containing protein [Arthrobacter bambusae]